MPSCIKTAPPSPTPPVSRPKWLPSPPSPRERCDCCWNFHRKPLPRPKPSPPPPSASCLLDQSPAAPSTTRCPCCDNFLRDRVLFRPLATSPPPPASPPPPPVSSIQSPPPYDRISPARDRCECCGNFRPQRPDLSRIRRRLMRSPQPQPPSPQALPLESCSRSPPGNCSPQASPTPDRCKCCGNFVRESDLPGLQPLPQQPVTDPPPLLENCAQSHPRPSPATSPTSDPCKCCGNFVRVRDLSRLRPLRQQPAAEPPQPPSQSPPPPESCLQSLPKQRPVTPPASDLSELRPLPRLPSTCLPPPSPELRPPSLPNVTPASPPASERDLVRLHPQPQLPEINPRPASPPPRGQSPSKPGRCKCCGNLIRRRPPVAEPSGGTAPLPSTAEEPSDTMPSPAKRSRIPVSNG